MQFKNSNNQIDLLSLDPVKDYLEGVGISKVSSFVGKPDEDDQASPFLIKDINKALEMLKKHIDRESTIFVQVDKQ